MKAKTSAWFRGLVRICLMAGAIAVMLAVMPRVDHNSYSYEVNQPWKYPLLTAEFDVPVLRDSASIAEKRDSINANFIPFVKRIDEVAIANQANLMKALTDSASGTISRTDLTILSSLLAQVYRDGVMDSDLENSLDGLEQMRVRVADASDPSIIVERDVAPMLTAGEAFVFIDSAYTRLKGADESALTTPMARALHSAINPNVVIDSVFDQKFRTQELQEVTAALGVIKQGQRIVDRGEIVTPQVYTNLQTYMKMLDEIDDHEETQVFYYLGRGVIIFLVLLVLYVYLSHYRPEFYDSLKQMSFLVVYITLFVVFGILMFEFVPGGLSMVPFAAVPVVVMVFFDSRTAIISLLATVLITSLVATFPQQFIIMQALVGIFAALSITQLTKRSQLLQTAVITFVTYCVAYTALQLVREGAWSGINYHVYAYFAINAIVLSFVYILILVIEKIFGFTSNVTLVELSDINNPLLRRLAQDAPGTFQHSVQVSTLAAEAALAIGANTLLTRTGALYHDIGKLESPSFFTENQHGVNPHNGLDPETSAKKIISHISCGLALAKSNKLPKVIRDFISQHHGKGMARYFYTTAVNERGMENVRKEDFQYPGPDPMTKETAILMMADAVEAASRSLQDYSQESITNLVNKIIDGQVADGMFKEAPISFRDIETIKRTFIKRLGNIYHTRISYPEMNARKDKEK